MVTYFSLNISQFFSAHFDDGKCRFNFFLNKMDDAIDPNKHNKIC